MNDVIAMHRRDLVAAVQEAVSPLVAENKALAAELARAKAANAYDASAHKRVSELGAAIRWALGEEGEFPDEPEPQGKYRRKYYWRTELRKRAGLSLETPAEPIPLGHSCRDGWRVGEMANCPTCTSDRGVAK